MVGACRSGRRRCLGCSHFRTDPSYLPELNEYLTQLLVSKERLQRPGSAVEPWARRSAMPSDEEITCTRNTDPRNHPHGRRSVPTCFKDE